MAANQSASFAALLRQYRRAAGLTQDELAEHARMSVYTISSLERGIYRPHKTTLALLIDALQLSEQDRLQLEAATRGSHTDIPPPPSNTPLFSLPHALTRLIGREQEIYRVSQMILRDQRRLVTLIGTAGIGKTRLAVAIASHLTPHFADGVAFIPLAHLQEWKHIPISIAQTLDLQEEPAQSLWDLITTYLAARNILIVLDNLEHLLEGAAFVVDLLLACPTLAILVTSRAPLRVRGEYRFPVPSLAADPDGGNRSDAEELFVERAREVQPLLAMTPANITSITAICRRLEGIPLAIELAAMRANTFTPSEILQRLDHRLSLLVNGPRDLPQRQRTMREAIAWSYDLLSPHEQAVFRRLSIFAGGWTFNAAQELCGADLLQESISTLIETNLIQRIPAEDAVEMRFTMPEILREYGLEQLTLRDELAGTQRRHAEYMLTFALEAGPPLNGPKQGQWLARLNIEQNNVRAVLQWADKHDPQLGLRIVAMIWRYWYMRRYLREGLAWLEAFLGHNQIPEDNGQTREQASYAASVLAAELGTFERAEHFAAISFSLNQETGNVAGMCKILNVQGYLAFRQDRFPQAEESYRLALALSHSLDDTGYKAAVLNSLAIIDTMQGRYQEAHALLEEGLNYIRAVDHQQGIAAILLSLSNVFFKEEDYSKATIFAADGLEHALQSGDRNLIAAAFDYLGKTAIGQGKFQQALELLEQSRQILEEADDTPDSPALLRHLGNVARLQNEWQQAETYYRTSIKLSQQVGKTLSVAKGFAEWAQALFMQGYAEQAARHTGKATTLLSEIDISPQADVSKRLQHLSHALRDTLGEDAFHVAWEHGKTLPLDDLLAWPAGG